MKRKHLGTNIYNRERLERLSYKKSFKDTERDALRDGVITGVEVKEMLEAYDRENIDRDVKLKERLSSYGHSISVDKWAHQIKVVTSGKSEVEKPVIDLKAPHSPFGIKYRKQIFLAIVIPVIILSLIGLL